MLLRKDTDLPVPPATRMHPGPEKDRKKKGPEKAMTDYVLDNTPLKSLGFKEASAVTEPLAKMESKRQDEDTISQGHKMKSLCTSADKLLAAATRLNKEVEKETNYWKQILAIRETGWSITRLPAERQNLAVRFGFAEATGNFKFRGLAALRAGETGDVVLDEALTSATKSLRVRVLDNGNVVGSSSLHLADIGLEMSIEHLIRRARDTLFDEELFQELARESRLLLPHNVTMDGNKIRVPYCQPNANRSAQSDCQRVIVLDLVGKEVASVLDHQIEDTEAQSIALALRLLLSYSHRQKLHQRSRIPLPIAERQSKEPPPPILRILMGYLQHKSVSDAVRLQLHQKILLFKKGGLSLDIAVQNASPDLGNWLQRSNDALSTKPNHDLSSFFDDLLGMLSEPLQNTFTLSMKSPLAPSKIELAVILLQTHLSSPIFGTNYVLRVLDADFKPLGTPDTDYYDSVDDIIVALTPIFCSCLAHFIVPRDMGWEITPGGHEAFKGELSPSTERDRIETSVNSRSFGITLHRTGKNKIENHVWTIDQDIKDTKTFGEVANELALAC